MNSLTLGVISPETPETRQANLRLLRAELRLVNPANVQDALRGRITAADARTLLDLVQLSTALDQAARTGNSALLDAYRNDDSSLTVVRMAREVLRNHQCTAAPTTARGKPSQLAPSQQGSESGGTQTVGKLRKLSVPAGLFILGVVLQAALLVGVVKYIRRWLRRRKQRLAKRYRVSLPITFSPGAVNYDGVMGDVSLLGFRIHHKGAVSEKTSDTIKVLVLDVWHAGSITWRDERDCGIALDEALDPTTLQDIREASRAREKKRAIGGRGKNKRNHERSRVG